MRITPNDIVSAVFTIANLLISITRLKPPTVLHTTSLPSSPPSLPLESKPSILMPTTQQTLDELKRRLAKELYRMELDLQGGGRIAGRPCDCLSQKHHLGIEATAEELMSYEVNPLYSRIINWMRDHQAEFEPEEIAKQPPAHYQGLAPEVRRFRKEMMGTESISAMLSEQERERVREQVEKKLKEEV